MPTPTYTLTIWDRTAPQGSPDRIFQAEAFGTLTEAYAAWPLPRYSVRGCYCHAPQVGLVAFADGSRYGA